MWKYITTPIFYSNAKPHIGHIYTTVYADAYARWLKSIGTQVIFTTGMDEHGLKIQRIAANRKISPKDFCDEIAARFQDLFSRMHIDYTRFYRTTEIRTLWTKLKDAGYIYKDLHEGWYCNAEERFVQRNQLIETTDGLMTKQKYPVEWVQEENYFFRVEPLKPKIAEWLRSPALDEGLRELALRELSECGSLSISRPRSRVHWGIAVPEDESHTIHVWMDALTSYLASVGFPEQDLCSSPYWKNTWHLLGMEISRFHSLHLPAFLLAAGLPPPAHLKIHSHWLNRSVKISKSLGNSVDPEMLLTLCTPDALRFFLLFKGPQNAHDSEFTLKDFAKAVNLLADRLGNLVARITSSKSLGTDVTAGIVEIESPEIYTYEEHQMIKQIAELLDTVKVCYTRADFAQGLVAMGQVWTVLNSYADAQAAWNNPKSHSPYVVLEALRTTVQYMHPVMPFYTSIFRKFLGDDDHKEFRKQGKLHLDLSIRAQVRIKKVELHDLDKDCR